MSIFSRFFVLFCILAIHTYNSFFGYTSIKTLKNDDVKRKSCVLLWEGVTGNVCVCFSHRYAWFRCSCASGYNNSARKYQNRAKITPPLRHSPTTVTEMCSCLNQPLPREPLMKVHVESRQLFLFFKPAGFLHLERRLNKKTAHSGDSQFFSECSFIRVFFAAKCLNRIASHSQ